MLTNSKQGGDGKLVRSDVDSNGSKHPVAFRHSADKTPGVFSTQTFPLAKYRDQAHQLAVEAGKTMFPGSDVVYKSSDSDGMWDAAEVQNWVAVAGTVKGEGDAEVITSAYRFKDDGKGAKKRSR